MQYDPKAKTLASPHCDADILDKYRQEYVDEFGIVPDWVYDDNQLYEFLYRQKLKSEAAFARYLGQPTGIIKYY